MGTYFFTGFPGFIASALLRQLLESEHQVDQVYLLVLPEFVPKAEEAVTNLMVETGIFADQITVIAGDITYPNMRLSNENLRRLQEQVEYVYHLAAIYDLAVPEKLAYRVNVTGTAHVNDWVRTLKHVKRYVYFSTAYVSGTREGKIYEHELAMNQTFKNHYEKTKFEAEVLVRGMNGQVPATIIRPGIVKGDSRTGTTLKFDGLYFMLNFFDRLRLWPWIPFLGDSKAVGNFVPVDYVLNATLYLGHLPEGTGKTYHLTDPHPYSMNQIYEMLMQEYLNRKPTGTIPLSLTKSILSLPQLRKWLKVEKEALDYFSCAAFYDSSQALQDLQGSGITFPDFKKTVEATVEFYRRNKHDPKKHIVIR
ncbi:SDR family oxidoreductase [Paenactinomyces guangxiensis]|uniref:SDR family oxidoreductase n=1 Tax=Paenactinomyces guangxiensis TaxID=1490290 RepID=A0A7W2A7E9_9BACL|nr:SDR family oxidoreductase [Paenactinomyces guangxiensis]MBA4493067.1 SDR family oxidoreductase [Paenactinomyces guangxiensis]MBH8590083.1 SDR family oxidoreductase [Paenactinomyces guangxiensis]